MRFFLRFAGTHFSTFFFFNDTAATEIYLLPLHDALPICRRIYSCIKGSIGLNIKKPACLIVEHRASLSADEPAAQIHTSQDVHRLALLESIANASTERYHTPTPEGGHPATRQRPPRPAHR